MKLLAILLFLTSLSHAAIITPFSSPENMEESVLWFVEESDNIRIATYTFDSATVATSLKGKNASIIVEKSPVGGLSNESKAVLCFLQDNGASVHLYDGLLRFMHAKYMVSGDISLISSENVGGYDNRGWGVILQDSKIAENLTYIFEEDLKDSVPLQCNSYEFKEVAKKGKKPVSYEGNAYLIAAPDAVDNLLALLDTAKERLWIEQFYIYRYWDREGKENPFLEKAKEKAESIDVRVILDGTWYNVDEDDYKSNYRTNDYLNKNRATSKIMGSLTVHNKAVIADNSVLVSSINWNENSPRNNREVGVVITGGAVDYFIRRFESDWNESGANVQILPFFIIVSAVVIVLWLVKGRQYR